MEGSGPLVFPHCPLLAAAGPPFLYDEDEEEDEEKTKVSPYCPLLATHR